MQGTEVREIKVDKHQQMILLNSLLIILNLFILISVIMLVVYIKRWYIGLLDFIIVAFCIYKSVTTSIKAKKNYRYKIVGDELIVNSLWYDTSIKLSTIYKIAPKKDLWDKLFNRNNSTLCVYFYDGGYYKVNLYNISEDAGELIKDIMDRVVKLKQDKN